MSSRVGWPAWSLEALPQWRVTDHPECLTLERSDEGALQLSSANKTTGDVSLADIQEYAESLSEGWGVAAPITCGEFTGIVYRYKENEDQWNRWFLRNGQTILFVTFNGSAGAQLMEYAEVEKMLSTLRREEAS